MQEVSGSIPLTSTNTAKKAVKELVRQAKCAEGWYLKFLNLPQCFGEANRLKSSPHRLEA